MKAFRTIWVALVCGSVVGGFVSTAAASEHGMVVARSKKKKRRQRQAEEEARQEEAKPEAKPGEKEKEQEKEKEREKEKEKEPEKAAAVATVAPKDHWREDGSTTKKDAGPLEPKPLARVLEPGHVDAKLLGNIDVLLAFVGVGAAVDVGVARAGNGTIGVGLAGEYAFCASVCWALSSLTSYELSQNQVSAWARGTYHIGFRGKGFRRLDMFPIVMAGPVFANASLKIGSTEFKASDVGVGIGAGFGLNYFPTDAIFVGAEARLRYAAGSYEYEVTSGEGERRRTLFDGATTAWSMSGGDFVVAFGARF